MFSPSTNWHPTEELCGYIDNSGVSHQLINLAQDPKKSFSFDKNLIPDNAEILWHSHPNNNCNLSVEDYLTFLKFPNHVHRIYGKTRYIEYYVRNNMVYQRE